VDGRGHDPARAEPIAVVGLMGSGKTTVGRLVAHALSWDAVDGDVVLQASTGCTAAELATRDGITALHALEAEVLLQSLSGAMAVVIMPAASTVDDVRCRQALEGAFVVWLDASPEVLASRVGAGDHRPLDHDVVAQLREQRAERAPHFAALADLTFDSYQLGPDAIADRVVRAVRLRSSS
jgi:shikimate kinase